MSDTPTSTPDAAAANRLALLEYQMSEVIGCLDEYEDMPCNSLRDRLIGACRRARISTQKEVTA